MEALTDSRTQLRFARNAHERQHPLMTMNGWPAAAAMDDSGRYVVTLRRIGDEWKVAYAIYNSDRPTPPAKNQ